MSASTRAFTRGERASLVGLALIFLTGSLLVGVLTLVATFTLESIDAWRLRQEWDWMAWAAFAIWVGVWVSVIAFFGSALIFRGMP